MKHFGISKSLTFLLIQMLLSLSPSIATEDNKDSIFPSKCTSMLKAAEETTEVWNTCTKSLKLEKELEPFTNNADTAKYFQQLEKSDFDDKCLGKCVAEKMGVLKDGHIDKDSFTTLEAKSEANPAAKKIFKAVWMACADKIESKVKEEGGMKDKECKFVAMFRHCLFTEGLKKRDELEATC